MAQIYVKKTGNDSSGNGSNGSPYLTLGKAYTVANANDEIIVSAGTYQESLRIEKNGITIRAADGLTYNDVIIDGNNYTLPPYQDKAGGTEGGHTYFAFTYKGLIDIWASNVTIKNLTLQNSKGRGFNVLGSSTTNRITNVMVDSIKIRNCRHAAGVSQFANVVVIKNCDSSGTGNYAPFSRSPQNLNWPQAFSIKHGNNVKFINNKLTQHWGEGIGVTQNLENFVISDNIIFNTYNTPIYLQRCNGGVVERNLVYSPNTLGNAANAGININSETSEGGNTGATFDTGDIIIRNNIVIGMKRNMSQLAGSGGDLHFQDITVENNTFINATESGIFIAGNAQIANMKIRNNIIYQGGGATGTVTNYNGGKDIEWDHNSWSSLPNTAARSASDVGIAVMVDPNDNINDNNVVVGNYAPQSGSPTVNAGNPASSAANDYYGNARIGVYDIGAIEFGGTAPPPPLPDDPNCITNLLSNGWFPNDLAGWVTSGTAITGTHVSNKAQLVVTSNTGTQQFYQNDLNIVSGQPYQLKFDVNGPNATEIRVDVIDDATLADLGTTIHNYVLTGVSQTVVLPFTATANSANGRVRFRFQVGTGTFTLDNICLVETTLGVDYTVSSSGGIPHYIGDVLSFTSTVSNTNPIVSYSWNFDDSTTLVTTQNATHTFATAGVYNVSLTVTDSTGATASEVKEITILNHVSETSTLKIGKAYISALVVTT